MQTLYKLVVNRHMIQGREKTGNIDSGKGHVFRQVLQRETCKVCPRDLGGRGVPKTEQNVASENTFFRFEQEALNK